MFNNTLIYRLSSLNPSCICRQNERRCCCNNVKYHTSRSEQQLSEGRLSTLRSIPLILRMVCPIRTLLSTLGSSQNMVSSILTLQNFGSKFSLNSVISCYIIMIEISYNMSLDVFLFMCLPCMFCITFSQGYSPLF